MLTFNASLKTLLDSATTKLDWSNKLQTALGNTRRLRCFRDSNSQATDPATTGQEFLNVGSTDPLTIAGGNITAFGKLAGVTVRGVVDLATGASVLRLEGNGNWVQGTLGLTGAATDFTFTSNITATAGIAFAAGSGAKAPIMMDSGTGPLSPKPDSKTPDYVIFWDCRGSNTGVEFKRIHFNRRLPNLVYSHPERAAEIGDVRVTGSDDFVTFVDMEFGMMLWAITPLINSEANEPWYEVGVVQKPTSDNWPGYPAFAGYKRGRRSLTAGGQTADASYGISNTFAKAFKITVHSADGTKLGTIDMPKDHLPINSPELSYVATLTKPIRPMTHCAQMLIWRSAKPKMWSKAKKHLPGVHARSLKPNIGKQAASFNGIYPLRWDQQGNSIGHWYAAPYDALPCNNAVVQADAFNTNDPYLYDVRAYGGSWGTVDSWMTVPSWYGVQPSDQSTLSAGIAFQQGRRYEPGSYCQQDQQTWAGGSRIDRGVFDTPTVIYMTDPNWVHMRDQTKISDEIWDWNNGIFNQPWHNVTDVRTFASINVDEVLDGKWADCMSHSAGETSYTSGGEAYAIPQFMNRQDSTLAVQPFNGAWVDENFRMPWNGAANDNMHAYASAGRAARLFQSPALDFSCKLRYLRSITCQMGGGQTSADANARAYYAIRVHAWKMMSHNDMWCSAADHELSIPISKVEKRIIAELTAVHRDIWVPVYQNNAQDYYAKALRIFGIPCDPSQRNGAFSASFSLTFYMAEVLQEWKQSGLFRRMWDYSEVTRNALMAIIKTLDAGGISFFTEVKGAPAMLGAGEYGGAPDIFVNFDTSNICTSWSDYMTRNLGVSPAQVGQADLVHYQDGTLGVPDTGQWLRSKWPFIRKYYFSDIPCDFDVDLAITNVKSCFAAWDTKIAQLEAAGTAKIEITRQSWNIFPHLGEPLPPPELGA